MATPTYGQDDNALNVQEQSASPEPDSTEAEGSSYNACIPLPADMADSVSEGDSFDGKITGTIINKDGKLSVEVETLNGEPVESDQGSQEEAKEPGYTGTEPDASDMSSEEALSKFMKGRKVTQ